VLSSKSSNNDSQRNLVGEHLVPVGQVLHPHGTGGEMVVYPYLDDSAYYEHLEEVVLGGKPEQLMNARVSQVRWTPARILLQFVGITSREAARPFTGWEILVPRASLPSPQMGDFYWYDLEGLTVVTEAGEQLGQVTDFFRTGSNDVLVVHDGERELLLPFIKDVILAIDKAQNCLQIRVLPGLL
jgi:16S rRNA processing protein RimM